MRALHLAFSILFITTPLLSAQTYQVDELQKLAESKSFEIRELRSSAEAARLAANARLADFSPELGVEGNWRYEKEKQKRKDLSYYAYGKWNLFRGLSDWHGWSTAQELSRIAQIRAKRASREIQLKVRKAYFEVLVLQRVLDLKAEHFKLSEDQVQMARKKINGGLATEADIYDFNIHQTSLKSDEDLINADLSEKWQDLERIVGEPLDRTRKLEEPAPLEIPNSSEDYWTAKAMDEASPILSARASRSLASGDKWSAWGELMPSADLGVKYGKLFESDFGESQKDSWAIVGTISLPLFDGFKRLNHARSKSYEFDRAQIELSRAELDLKSSTKLLLQKVNSLTRRFALEQEKLKLSQRYYEITLSEYRRGVKNSPDLASASDRLFDAKQDSIQLKRDLEVAKADLLMIAGSN